MSRRYVVIGAGALGTVLAAGFADAGIPAVLVARGAVLAAIRAHGLHYTRVGVSRVLPVEVVGGPDELALTPDDVLVLALKTQDAAATVAAWTAAPVVTPDGPRTAGEVLPIVALQNGLDAERAALRHADRVLSGTTLLAAVHVEPGRVAHHNAPASGQIVLGAYPSAAVASATAAEVPAIAADLRAGGWLVQETADPGRWKAWKTAAAATFAVAVLGGSDDERAALRADVQDEARAALRAGGFDLADPRTETTVDAEQAAVDPGYGVGRQSLRQSFERGSGIEADYLNGEIVLQARLAGVDAPLNAALQRILAASAAAGEPVGTRSVAEVRAAAHTSPPRPPVRTR